MIFLSVGLPSRFAEWCDGTICALVQAALGPVDLVSANTFEEMGLAFMKSQAPHLVIGARQPTEELRVALSQMGRRFVVALDDPHAAFQNLVTRHGLEWKAAIRAAAGSCASLLRYEAVPGALMLRADREGRNPLATAIIIADWLNLEINLEDTEALLRDRPDPGLVAAQGEFDAWWATISGSDRALVDGALNGYVDYFSDARMGQLVWARDLFFIGDDPYAAADRVIDVSGPVRNLLFGPYMTLPSGEWEATIVLGVSKEAADLGYSVEILAGSRFACLARETIRPNSEGICEATIKFGVSETTDQPIEFRVANLQHAFGGRLALVHVALSPLVMKRSELPAELTMALGW